ncbi:MAG: VOC family protein [Pseudomonadota bacterium]
MINHIMIGASDLEKSKAFYNTVLGVLGAGEPHVDKATDGQTRLFYIHDGSVFSVTEPKNGEPASCGNGFTIGFKCASPEQLKEFHDVAVANGATSIEDPPGPRNNSMGEMYLCYFRDPDGNKICGIHMPQS